MKISTVAARQTSEVCPPCDLEHRGVHIACPVQKDGKVGGVLEVTCGCTNSVCGKYWVRGVSRE